jgi:nitroreductase
MTRREVLQAGAAGAVVATGCARLPGGDARSPVDSGLPGPAGPALDLARRAPSSHNSQPWRVAVHGADRVTVRADLGRRLPAVDPDDRELWISVGAFLETLVAGARALGVRAEVEPAAPEDAAAASVRLAPGGAPDPSLERAIRIRRTLRKDLATRALTADDRAALSAAAGPGVALQLLGRGAREAEWLTGSALAAFEAQTWRDPAQEELGRWIRFSHAEEERRGDGLTPDGMELGGLAAFWMRTFMDRSDVETRRFRQAGIDGARAQLAEGAGFLVLSTPADDRQGRLEAGRAFARLGLEAVRRGIGLHPMSQMLEEPAWRAELPGALRVAGVPQFVIRLGYRSYPGTTPSPRRTVKELVEAA